MTVDSTVGWTLSQWKQHTTLAALLQLVASQSPSDPAWISVASPEQVIDQWDLLQTRPNSHQLPLYGVPVAVKDNIDVLGMPTTAACPSFSYQPSRDAQVVSLLRAAGAIVVGKTNLDQFATGLVGTRSPYGAVPNTFDPAYVSGGSSSGSASVVARGIVPLALGTDTAGSGRVPAMLNNLIGLKPTKGAFSCSGVVPACKSLDCVSVFALTLEDAQVAFEIMAAGDEKDQYSRELPKAPVRTFGARPRLAIPKNPDWFSQPENGREFEASIAEFKKIAEVVEIDFSPMFELAKCLYEGPWVAERYAATREFMKTNPDPKTLDPTVTKIIATGAVPSAATAFEYEYRRQQLTKQIWRALEGIDALVVPTAPLKPTMAMVAADPVGVNSIQGTYTNFVNLADMCGLAIPTSTSGKVPFGVTLLGRAFTDYALLELAQRVLKERPLGCLNKTGVDCLPKPSLDLSAYLEVAVVGAHLRGFPLHWQLEKVGAVFQEETTTSSSYKLYALPGGLKPGLRRVDDGVAIALEVYAVPVARFGEFMAMIPQPLGIGTVELASGRLVKSFICEESGYTQPGTVDISSFGGWKNYKRQTPPFERVLVANRGEIAVRLIRTVKKLGIKAVAVYSDPDEYAQHVTEADESVPLVGVSAADTYINIDKIIAAAKATGAQAILPGYGFLSENADFSARCDAEGIVFVGPSGDAITKLGLKHSAREIAKEAGVPLVPGSDLIESAEEALKVAKSIGYPVMVKSTAGGGGIGLQKVDNEDEMERVFATVQHQARSYFGNAGVFIERFIGCSRHVEIQLFGDGRGEALALGERDCSLQRRNQKVVEETPAPNLPAATRAKMISAAESLGRLLKYKGAATVEFIYDQAADEFYFLEVNARLQVEHPITEEVTGLDLVEWMLLIASNNPPEAFVKKSPPQPQGHSIECRVYAENPVKDFMPSPGQLTEVSFPSWCRVDSWVSTGTVVSGEYDPTLAKIIVHGSDRAEALALMARALEETVIWGVATNLDYLKSIVASDMVHQATMHTKSLDTFVYEPRAFEVLEPGSYTTVQDLGRRGYWHIGVPPSGCMDDYAFRLGNQLLDNDENCPGLEITLSGPSLVFHQATKVAVTGGEVSVELNGQSVPQWAVVSVPAGGLLAIGKLTSGCRAYLTIVGGIEVQSYLGSKSTFALGNLGGFNGRTLRYGDVLGYGKPNDVSSDAVSIPTSLVPSYNPSVWQVGVTCGPHGSPDFFKTESIAQFFADTWKVHYNSNRFGVRLIGPKPQWARADGGDAGLHPSNAHDYVYSMGAINFTGDEPVILTCDGPSLGGFVCAAVVCEAEMWKIGQVKPGDSIQFVPVTFDTAVSLRESQKLAISQLDGQIPEVATNIVTTDPILYQDAQVCYRQAGDRYVLVEIGEQVVDLDVAYQVHHLVEQVSSCPGIVEMSRGVRSVLVEFDPKVLSQAQVVRTLELYRAAAGTTKEWSVPSRVIRLPMAFEDSKTLEAVQRYQETIRSSAPWLPNNVDFLADVNGTTREAIHDLMYSARFLVLGLGDVFLGAPCAVPLDPRQRLLGTKYNPSRTYTPNGTVGIGGNYMCIYTMESPGGYQLIGRTVPIWDKLSISAHSDHPWMLRPFDQIEFYPASEADVDKWTAEMNAGKFAVDIETAVFDNGAYTQWLEANKESIEEYQASQGGEKLEEFNRLIQISNSEIQSVEQPLEEVEIADGCQGVYSEFSGRFWKSAVAVGDQVTKGQALVVVEAMKTEMMVVAPRDGTVVKVVHSNGDMVDAGDLVAVIE